MSPKLVLESIKKALGIKEDHMIISGPCSAESEEQVLNTCRLLADTGKVHMLRAGIWKPRTRPNSFEGMGEKALPWLIKAGKETGLPVTTEVANAQHVEICLKYGVDVLWIGARTTVSPFAVQEIADALKGVDIPVMVKNPINPDLELWVGALERINQSGIRKLAAIHRGYSSSELTSFRNAPMWDMAVHLKTMIPDLEIICDPSHIAGARDLVPLVAQKALDLHINGLMIESHHQPDAALSDAAQQLKPSAVGKMLSSLVYRKPSSSNSEFVDQLENLRGKIDEVDEKLLENLSIRMKIAEQIGQYKRENQVTILQVNRWSELVADRVAKGRALGLSENMLSTLLDLIHKESIERQNGSTV